MTEVLLVDNPRRSRKKKRKSNRRPSAAQLRARRAFVKMVRAKSKTRRRTRRNPSKVKHRPVFFGTKKRLGSRSTHKRLNPRKGFTTMAHRRRRRKFRRNPSFAGLRSRATSFGGQFKNAAIGAVGIVVNNQIKPMISGLLGNSLGTFQPLLNAAVPILIGNFAKSPAVKLAAQTAASVELAQLMAGIAGPVLGPALPAATDTTKNLTRTLFGVDGDDDSIPPPLGR